MEVKAIVDGFKNLLIRDDKVEKKAIKREKICRGCPYIIKNTAVERCSLCGCFIKAKVRQDNVVCKFWIYNNVN